MAVQAATREKVALSYVDKGCTRDTMDEAIASHGIQLHLINLDPAKDGFPLFPKRWVVERSSGWAGSYLRLTGDDELLFVSLAALRWLALSRVVPPP